MATMGPRMRICLRKHRHQSSQAARCCTHVNHPGQRGNTKSKARPVCYLGMVHIIYMMSHSCLPSSQAARLETLTGSGSVRVIVPCARLGSSAVKNSYLTRALRIAGQSENIRKRSRAGFFLCQGFRFQRKTYEVLLVLIKNLTTKTAKVL